MAIDLTRANAYFDPRNHTDSELWYAFDEEQRVGAIAEAKRRLITAQATIQRNPQTGSTPFQQDDLLDEDTTTDTDGLPRHDLAVYEQALHTLLHSDAIANGNRMGPKWVAKRISQKRKRGISSHSVGEKASYYMGWSPKRVFFVRGG